MSFPTIAPSKRGYKPGNWPVRTYSAMDGAEVRIIYGNRRTGSVFDLEYQNISDAKAQLFLEHYNAMLGTYTAFQLPTAVLKGWAGSTLPFDPENSLRFRYAEQPTINAVKPGVSTVSVSLMGVLL